MVHLKTGGMSIKFFGVKKVKKKKKETKRFVKKNKLEGNLAAWR